MSNQEKKNLKKVLEANDLTEGEYKKIIETLKKGCIQQCGQNTAVIKVQNRC